MKKFILPLVLLLVCASAFSQEKRKRPAMPEEGFWVIQNHVKTPKESIVYYYNNRYELIYTQAISGRRLKVWRPKIAKQLNAVLSQSLIAWNKTEDEKNTGLAAKKNE